MKDRLGIFAKEPLPGGVKTRLCPPLSPTEAAALYRSALEETVRSMTAADLRPTLFYAGGREFFERTFPGLPLIEQSGGDLGERIDQALAMMLRGGEKAVLIGTDSPDLPPALVKRAFAALQEAELVTVPARDGGYVLIGERGHRPELFRGIPWSTAEVLAATEGRAAELGVSCRRVAEWEDVDDIASLRRLVRRSPESATADHARRHLAVYLAQGS